MEAPNQRDEVVIPALLRAARGAYAHAVRARLTAGGFEDLPGNGPYILGGMANRGGTAGNLIRELGVSKQAASQLIDTLVLRGYLSREINPDDRRRMNVVLTEHGCAAAAAIRTGIAEVDTKLAGMLSPDELAGLRAGLAALGQIAERTEHD